MVIIICIMASHLVIFTPFVFTYSYNIPFGGLDWGRIFVWKISCRIIFYLVFSGVRYWCGLWFVLNEDFTLGDWSLCFLYPLYFDFNTPFFFASLNLFSILLFSHYMQHSDHNIISSVVVSIFWAKNSLKCPTLRPFWKAPTNISWFGWVTLLVSLLKWAKYS